MTPSHLYFVTMIGEYPPTPIEKSKKKMSKPTQKRTKEIKIRLTEQEHQILQNKKTGAELATWIRETCLGTKTKKRSYKPVDPLLLRELGKIGGNLNQIAKNANTDVLEGKINHLRLLTELTLIREQLDELLKRYDS